MVCRRCKSALEEEGRGVPLELVSSHCSRCGAEISSGRMIDFLDKLTQLARFGLSGEDRPLLEPADD